jgi:hypothetical protein
MSKEVYMAITATRYEAIVKLQQSDNLECTPARQLAVVAEYHI